MQDSIQAQYDPHAYPSFAVTVDVAVFTIRHDTLRVLLIERGEEPYQGTWALPGGFVRPDEDLESAAARELEEETGVTEKEAYLEQLRSYGAPERDPRMRIVTVAYWAICANLALPRAGGDAARADLVPVSEVEDGYVQLAFDHDTIVHDALERVRSKLEYTAVGSKFCPPEFTISDLRRVYEAAWNTRLDPGNFSRNVRASGSFERIGPDRLPAGAKGGRPASLWSAPVDLQPPRLPIARRHKPDDDAD